MYYKNYILPLSWFCFDATSGCKSANFHFIYTLLFADGLYICDMIMRNESDVGKVVFEILAKTVFKFLCFVLFLAYQILKKIEIEFFDKWLISLDHVIYIQFQWSIKRLYICTCTTICAHYILIPKRQKSYCTLFI